ncbi:MAG: DUF1800 family protein, partial [Bacteroidota bacterium]
MMTKARSRPEGNTRRWKAGSRHPQTQVVGYTQPMPVLQPLAVQTTLDTNTDPLTASQARHLLRRTQFGATPAQIQALVGRPANQVVDELMLAARNTPLPPNPSWYNTFPTEGNEETYGELSFLWFETELMPMSFVQLSNNAFAEKMMMFWQNHFVTQFFDNLEISPLTLRYVNLLRTHSFG